MWLPWTYAAVYAAVCVLAVALIRPLKGRPVVRAFVRESAIIAALYAMWMRAQRLDPFGSEGGFDRGLSVYEWSKRLQIDHERTVHGWVLGRPLLEQASNLYYGGMHVPGVGILLVWLFVRHRHRLPVWRTTLALTTAACLVIRWVPVAPPRFFPELGFVDIAALHNQSVYGPVGTGVSGQFAAMPSIHVAWAVLVGAAAMMVTRSNWRWLGVAHAILTLFVVTSTANHWLLDGVVGAALIVPAYGAARWFHRRDFASTASVRDHASTVDEVAVSHG